MEKFVALIRKLLWMPQANITFQQAIAIAQAEFTKKSSIITKPRIARYCLNYYCVAIHGNRKGGNTLYFISVTDGVILDVIRLP